MSTRTTVLFFHTASDSFGGGSQMLLRLLKSIDRDEFEPVVLAQFRDELCRRAEECGIRIEIVPFRGLLDTYNRGLLSLSLQRTVRTGLRICQFNVEARRLLREADVIWCKNLRATLTLGPYALVSKTPIIWNIGLGLESEGKMAYLNEVGLRLADRVFIESRRQAQTIFTDRQYKAYEQQFTVFNKGIDVNSFHPASVENRETTNLRVGTAASLTPRKGLEYFVDAAAEINSRPEWKNVEFLIAGEPSTPEDEEYAQTLRDHVAREGLEDQVRFLSWVDEMPEYLASLDIFVLPSLNEGIPGAVREALAMEVPVVATDVGGTADVVRQDETGLLVKPQDADAIANSIEYLLSHPSERDHMGTNGRELIVEEFSLEAYTRQYEDFFRRLSPQR